MTENQLRWSKGYGLADLENSVPAKADTAYRLASIAKSITAVAVLQLVERGKLDLNAPINKYCAAYPEKQTLKDAPDKQFSIPVRQLLVHQSGIRHNKPDEVLTTKHYNYFESRSRLSHNTSRRNSERSASRHEHKNSGRRFGNDGGRWLDSPLPSIPINWSSRKRSPKCGRSQRPATGRNRATRGILD